MDGNIQKETELLQDVLQRTRDAEMGYQNIADCTTDPRSHKLAVEEVEWEHRFEREIVKASPHVKDGLSNSGTLSGWLLRRWKDMNAMVGSNRGMLKAAESGNAAIVRSYQSALEINPRSAEVRDTLQRQLAHVYSLKSTIRRAVDHLS